VGEIDPLGARADALDAFLDHKLEEGYVIETRPAPTRSFRDARKASNASRVAQIPDAM